MKLLQLNIFGISILISFSNILSAADLPDIIDKIRPSVVAVGTIKPLGKPSVKFSGTGFVVYDGQHIVTNYHVLPTSLDDKYNERIAVFSGRGKTGKGLPAQVVKIDKEHDLALLKISGTKLPALTLESNEVIREGQQIAFTGFPIGMVLGLYPVTHQGIISAITPIATPTNTSKSLSAKQVTRLRNRFNVYQLDGTAYPGNSGSPAYDINTGKVIGVLNSVFIKESKETLLEKPSGISYAIPIKYVRPLLGKK